MNENTFERSAVVNHIITRKPGFIEKWALWIILILLIVLFWSSSLIKYPITTKITGNVDTILYNKPGVGFLAKLTIPGSYPDTINSGQKVQLSFYRHDKTPINVQGYIHSLLKSADKKQLSIIVEHSPNFKLSIAKNSSVVISITSKKHTVMQMFYRTVTNGIKL